MFGIYGKMCVPSAPVCLVSVLAGETVPFISKTAYRGQSEFLLFTMRFKTSKNTISS